MQTEYQQKPFAGLRLDWTRFLATMLSPSVVALLAVTLILLAVQAFVPKPETVSAIIGAALSLMISVFSGLVGALIWDRWTKAAEAGVLASRGKSAIRGLKLLLSNIAALERRVAIFCQDCASEDERSKRTLQGYAEIGEKCNSLEEAVIDAIEDWQDVVPGAANLNSQIGLITQLKAESVQVSTDIEAIRSELQNEKSRSQDEAAQLKKLLEKKESQLKQLRSDFNEAQGRLSSGVLAGSSASFIAPSLSTGQSFGLTINSPYSCPHCGSSLLTSIGMTFCPSCGKKVK